MLSPDAFAERLRTEVESRSNLTHPFFQELRRLGGMGAAATDDVRRLARIAGLEVYHLTTRFERYIAGLFVHCPRQFRRHLALNLYEEVTGRISKTDGHLELMERFLFALGLTRAELEAATPLPTTRELVDFRRRLVEDETQLHRAAAAVMIASEHQNIDTSNEGRLRHEMFPPQLGLKEEDVLFFEVHATEDIAHVKDGIRLVVHVCTTAEMQAQAIAAIHETCDRFWSFYTGIMDRYRDTAPGMDAARAAGG